MKCPKCGSQKYIRGDLIKEPIKTGVFFKSKIICQDCGHNYIHTDSFTQDPIKGGLNK